MFNDFLKFVLHFYQVKFMKSYLFFVLTVIPFLTFTQSGSYYGNPSDAAELCGIRVQASNSFNSNQEAQKALDKIIAVTGISKRFALYQCSGINNCEAITFRGIRYIFYDQNFMKSITATAGSWTNLSILAHEVGHHVNAHSLDWLALASGEIQGITLEQKRQQEIEADEFSGFVLAKLGATLIQAQAAIKLASDDGDDTYSTHPSRSKRLSAIERGYNQAKGITTKPYATATLTSEDYFYLAYNSDKNDVKISNYTKCIQLNSGIITAYLNRGNVYKDEKRFTEALSDFDKVIDLAKNSKSQSFKNFLDDGYRGKGWCYRQMIYSNENDADYYHQKAITEFTNAVNIDPNVINYLARAKIFSDRLYKTEENSSERSIMANKALNDYNSAARLDPNDPDIYHYRGNLFEYYLNDKNSALRDYSMWGKLEPNVIWPHFYQGTINIELEDYKSALIHFNKTIGISKYGLAYFNRALTFIKLERYTDAFNDLTTCISIAKDTTNESYFEVEYKLPEIYWKRAKVNELLKNYSAAVSDYSKIIEITKNDPGVYTYLNRANSYIKLKKFDLALLDLNKAIIYDPTNPDTYNSRGYFYQFTLEKNDKAIDDYNKAFSIDKDYLPAYYNRGIIYMDNDEYENAINDFSKVIQNDDMVNPEVFFLRGVSYIEIEKYDLAINDFDNAIELFSNNADYYYNRGLAKYNLNKTDEAINDFNKAIEIYPKYDNAYYYKGLTYYFSEQYDLAIKDFSKAIEINPKYYDAYVLRGSSKHELKMYQQALLDYNKAIEINSKDDMAYMYRGNTNGDLKLFQQALLDYNKAIEINPTGLTYYNRGLTKLDANNKTGACADWKKAVELGYNDAQSLIDENCQ
jgi:tetratricopeptide (TPR) repeat protein